MVTPKTNLKTKTYCNRNNNILIFFYRNAFIKAGKWAVIYLRVMGDDLTSFYDLDFRTVPTMWYIFFYILLLQNNLIK
jgi:hypothetical protein